MMEKEKVRGGDGKGLAGGGKTQTQRWRVVP